MTFAEERALIETRFIDQWNEQTPAGMPDHAFTPPEGESSVRLTIKNGEGRNATIGAPGDNIVRHTGVVMIQVFVPAGVGSAAWRELVDDLEPIFTNWHSGHLLFRSMSVSEETTEPKFKTVTVSFPFQRDTFI